VLQVSGSIKNKGSSDTGSFAAVPAQNTTANLHVGRSRDLRLDVKSGVVIRLVNLAADVRGQIIDISKGGCRIRTDRPFPVGAFRRVEVDFCVGGLPFRFPGVTQAIYDRCSIGIRFIDLSERKREQLEQLLDEIGEPDRSQGEEGQSPPAADL
jgi:c-di-GMP-binding flagellar brake protein YcgR